jgi:hypothetical protein
LIYGKVGVSEMAHVFISPKSRLLCSLSLRVGSSTWVQSSLRLTFSMFERSGTYSTAMIFPSLRQLFRAAVRAELIETNPVDLERDEPRKADKDPTWRADAVTVDDMRFIADARILEDRRVLYAIEFPTGSRR